MDAAGIYFFGGFAVNTEILMAGMGVITLSACYVGWHYAKQAHDSENYIWLVREQRNQVMRENAIIQSEVDRQADIIARYQAKKPERDTNGKFTSKKARVTAELQAYVASKKAVQ